MITQHLLVLGSPIRCDTEGCTDIAAVALRVYRDGAGYEMNYCELCWLQMQRAYHPLVARDEQSAVQEAEKLIAGDDDQQKAGVKA